MTTVPTRPPATSSTMLSTSSFNRRVEFYFIEIKKITNYTYSNLELAPNIKTISVDKDNDIVWTYEALMTRFIFI